MILRTHAVTPQKPTVAKIVEGLRRGDIFVIPTDTVYALVCSLDAPRSINELYRIKRMEESHMLSLLCRDVAMVSAHAHGMPTNVFRAIKAATPGPYTFILKASRQMGKRGTGKRKEVGIRIVKHPLVAAILGSLDTPLIATSVTSEDELSTDPEDLDRLYGHRVEAVLDGGICYHVFSTVVDCTGDEMVITRRGAGEPSVLGHTVDATDAT